MNNTILFSEKQRFNQWWLWVILLGINGLIGYGVLSQVVLGKPFGEKPAGNVELVLIFLLTLVIMFFFVLLRLETMIRSDGIYVRFFPFHISFKYFPWDRIRKSYVRKYSPIMEYGGWGLRGIGKNKALNVSGNQGLQLELDENRKLLIGTRKPEEISRILQTTRHN